jgi:hypothetical protein
MSVLGKERLQDGSVLSYHDDGGDKLIVNHAQDVEPILDTNKAMATHNDGYNSSRTMRRVASIPNVVIEQWKKEGVDLFNPNHKEAVRRKLNSSEFAYLRTAPGRL